MLRLSASATWKTCSTGSGNLSLKGNVMGLSRKPTGRIVWLFVLGLLVASPACERCGDPGLQNAGGIEVVRIEIAPRVREREPVGAGERFPPNIGKVYCFTEIATGELPVSIRHAWYFGDEPVASITLSVRESSWRTWSSKVIDPSQKGRWRVEVLAPGGETLARREFVIGP